MEQSALSDETTQPTAPPADAPAAGACAAPLTSAARVDAAIAMWQQQLLNLARSNSLLFFDTGRGPRGIAIAQPTPPALFERLANDGRKQIIARPPSAASQPLDLGLTTPEAGTPAAPERLDQTAPTGAPPRSQPTPRLKANEILLDADAARHDALLYRLRLRARSALQEQGIEVLYVAFGLLEWTTAIAQDGQPAGERVRSPLLLLPVRLDRARSIDPYILTPLDESPILNPALAYQLETVYQLRLTLPDAEADGDWHYAAVLDAMREQIAARPGWSISDGAYLGLFSFAKQAMYADLAATRDRLTRHPMVRALAGVRGVLPHVPLPNPTHLDDQEQPSDTFQVLDADASQRTVLAAIRRGGNLVVQGPPGTGKSQTIANAIAETLARGKTVLFVSEKLAALQVVARRLQAAGLGDFCLEAHGHGGDKAAIVKALADALPQSPHLTPQPTTDTLAVLQEQRAALNAYARALHDNANPLGMSAFTVHGELARRIAAPRVLFDLATIGELTVDRAIRMVSLVRRLAPLAGVVTAPEQHPWHGYTQRRWTPLIQAQLETMLDRLARAAEELAEAQADAAARWSLWPESSLAGSEWLLQVLAVLDNRPPALARWLARSSTADLAEQARSWGARCQGYSQRRLRLLSHYREEIFQLDLPAVAAALERVEVAAIECVRGDGPAADRALVMRAAVESAARRALRAIPAALAAAADVADRMGLPAPTTRTEAEHVLQAADIVRSDPRPERSWLQPGRLGQLIVLADEAAHQCVRSASNRATLTEQFDPKVLTAITPALAERFDTAYTSWTRTLRPSWYGDIGLLRRHLRPERASGGLSYADAAVTVEHWREMADADQWLKEQAPTLATAFARQYLGPHTDWEAVQSSLDSIRHLTDVLGDLSRWPRVAALLLAPDGPPSLDLPAERLRAALAECDAAQDELAAVAHVGDGWSGPLPALAANLERWLAVLAPLWWAADALNSCRRTAITSVADLLGEVRDALFCSMFEREFGAAMPDLAFEFGPFFKGLSTDWRRILDALTWTERLRACFDRPPPRAFLLALDAEPPGPIAEGAALHRAIGRLHELRDTLSGSFENGGPRIGSQPFVRAPLAGVAAWARSRHAALPRLREWIDAQALLGEIDAAGIGGFAAGLVREAPPVHLWEEAFLRQLFTLWLSWRYDQSPALAGFRRETHETTVHEFAEGDRQQWELAAQRITATLLPKRPAKAGLAVGDSEVGLLVRESIKKKRFKPLRRLFKELPHLLPALKPCLLMSPLSVAQHLGDSAVMFDLVVFDEASQVLPADAIGAIGRGKQVVIVGDRRQLPPTRFFQVTSLDTASDDEDDDEAPESILDACLQAGVPERSLLWHYRSRHEHLIAFSNAQFYDGRLETFPSPDADERVVAFHHVANGVYYPGSSRRTNPVEAAAVADLVVEHVQQQAAAPAALRQSLGVIAFSEAQMLAILAELEARKRANPALEPLLAEDGDEALFVKNLESVQGDERDVILFSVGYGRDPDGKMAMRFGPLNAAGGERRLNVAVTRARRRVTVVSSIRAHDIDGSPERPAGVRALRQYLAYAEHGPASLFGVAGGTMAGKRPDRPFETAVREAITARLHEAGLDDLEVVANVGVGGQPVDLAVRDAEGRYLLGIECDGAVFAGLPTARDRDRLRQEVLGQLGWQLHRVWSTDWVTPGAQRQELDRILAAIERARLIRDGVLPHDAPLSVLKPDDRPGTQGGARPNAPIPLGGRQVENVAVQILPAAPVAETGSQPVVSVPEMNGTRPSLSSDGATPVPTSAPDSSSSATQRPRPAPLPIVRVPMAAIEATVRDVLARAFAIRREALVEAVAREMGYQRTGKVIRASIDTAIRQLEQRGMIAEVGGNLKLTDA